jgi:hypothetical protein
MSGQFDRAGRASNTLFPRNQPALTVAFQMDWTDSDRVLGTVTNDNWQASFSADRATFSSKANPAPAAGRYTLIVPGQRDSLITPAGDGYGTVVVDGGGHIRLVGALADGTKISQSAVLSKTGSWPLSVPLYAGQGLLWSWVSFASAGSNDLSGALRWIKPNLLTAKYYPSGFDSTPALYGARYERPAQGQSALNGSMLQIQFAGGDLTQVLSEDIQLAGSKVLASGGAQLTLSFIPASGLFKGRVTNPVSARAIPFSGVVLQSRILGSGYFLGPDQSGWVSVGQLPSH